MTMQKFQLSRRKFLTSATLGMSALALSGCDALDSLSNSDNAVRNFIEGANSLTYRVQRLLRDARRWRRSFRKATSASRNGRTASRLPTRRFTRGC